MSSSKCWRLAALTAPPAADDEPNTIRTIPRGGERDPSVPPPRKRPWRTSRPVVAGSFALTLVAGIAAGVAIAAPASVEPMKWCHPPSRRTPDSITFYGEVDGVRFWTATSVGTNQDCIIAMSNDGGGAGGCAAPGWPEVAVELPRVGDRPFIRVSFDFSNPTARPVVDSSRS